MTRQLPAWERLQNAQDAKLRQLQNDLTKANKEIGCLHAALSAVEYISPEEGFKWYCPVCHYYQGKGHADNCTTGNALKGEVNDETN